jgi:hypothetical protein
MSNPPGGFGILRTAFRLHLFQCVAVDACNPKTEAAVYWPVALENCLVASTRNVSLFDVNKPVKGSEGTEVK